LIEVAAAIIRNEAGLILIARRREGKSQAGLWEFPGGKLEPGESPEACIRRELREEMNIDVEALDYFAANEHDYGSVSIRLIGWHAVYRGGDIRLTDHDDYRWAALDELGRYSFAPADIPLVERLVRER